MNKKLAIPVILIALLGLSILVSRPLAELNWSRWPIHKKMSFLITLEIERYRLDPKNFPFFSSVKEIKIVSSQDEVFKQLKFPKVHLDASGKHELEILLHLEKTSQKNAILVQYDMVDLTSKNVVWEHSRFFDLGFPSLNHTELLQVLVP